MVLPGQSQEDQAIAEARGLSAEQVKVLMRAPNADTMRGKRDRAIIAILVGCGLRRSEVAELKLEDMQQRDERWVILDLYGKGGHIRTVPVPEWVKRAVDSWTAAADVTDGLFAGGSAGLGPASR